MQSSIQECIEQVIQQNPVIKNIFEEIHKQGGKVLLVGGAVRDCLLQKFGSDLDFEVYHMTFEQLEQILQKFGKVSFVGKSFGVLRLHDIDADWSIPRIDNQGRKPTVNLDPDMSYEQAFKRRDVTVNAMGINVHTRNLVDPYQGVDDLRNEILRSPDINFFVQDPLRLFRLMQFVARLHMTPNDELNEVCKTMDISTISSERIDSEFKKLFLKSVQPSRGLRWLQKIDRFSELFVGLKPLESLFISIDCLAAKKVTDEQKLSAMWGLIAYHIVDVEFKSDMVFAQFKGVQEISNNIVKEQSKIKDFLKRFLHKSDMIQHATMIAWYVRYIPVLTQQQDIVPYKWLAYWVAQTMNLEMLSIVGYCLFEPNMMEDFIMNAGQAGVLQEAEEPLLQGKDLLDQAEGKELGALLKKAYAIQLNQGVHDKEQLMRLVIK